MTRLRRLAPMSAPAWAKEALWDPNDKKGAYVKVAKFLCGS